MSVNKDDIKSIAFSYGANLVGIASVDSFKEAPDGTHPTDVMPGCKSVIVVACEFPKESLEQDAIAYTRVRNEMTDKMNLLAWNISKSVKALGYDTHVITAISTKWIEGRNKGAISLKHAAVLAGLGKIGKNTLLVNDKYGNMLWLSAVLTEIPVDSDLPADYTVCNDGCSLCIKNCPSNALGNEYMNQRACANFAFKTVEGKLEIRCWKCRQICPYHLGLRLK